MAEGMSFQLCQVGGDHFLTTVCTLLTRATSLVSMIYKHHLCSHIQGPRVWCAYNSGRFGSLDREAVGLDRRSRTRQVCLLMFALDLDVITVSQAPDTIASNL